MQKCKDTLMLIFLDLETTGLEISDKICSIGMICIREDAIFSKYELVNEGKKIPPKASSINHITNEMIKDRAKFQDSKAFKILYENNNQDSTIIAHNVKFDLKMLEQSGFFWQGNVVDTLRATRHLIPECEEFSLQFLRYELRLYKDEIKEAQKQSIELLPHNALSDALHVKLLYEYLLEIKEHDELVALSLKNVLIEKFNFGKYSGRYIEEIGMYDRGYLEWMLLHVEDLDEDLRYSISRFL